MSEEEASTGAGSPTGRELTIGTRVTVYWPDYDQWYKGTVVEEDLDDKERLLIHYDDGDEAWMDTAQDRWRRSHKPSGFLKEDTLGLIKQQGKLDRLNPGSRVSVYWPQFKEYYNGTVKKIEFDEKSEFTLYLIYYDDGDKEWANLLHRKFKNVKSKSERLEVGSRVSVWEEEEKTYYPATVTKIKPERCGKPHKIRYDDKNRGKEWRNFHAEPFLAIEDCAKSGSGPVNAINIGLKKRKPEFMQEQQINQIKVGERKRAKVKQEEPEKASPKAAAFTEICNICSSVAKRPRATPCHHIFCKRCITNDAEFKTSGSCPRCRRHSVAVGQLVQYQPDHVTFKPVEALDRTTAQVRHTFSSASAAALHLSGKPSPYSIITACQSKRRDDREFLGYYWRFQGSKDRILRVGEAIRDGVAVEQVNLETGEVIEVFPSGRKAHEKTGVSRVVIRRVLERRGKACGGGWFWRYKGESHGPWPDPEPASKTAVEQLDYKTGDVLNSYASLADAKRAMGLKGNHSCIREVCNGQGRATAQGFFWRWKGSEDVPNHMWGVTRLIEIRKTKNGEVVKAFRTSREVVAYFGYQACWSTFCGYAREKKFSRGYYWQYRELRERKSEEEKVVGKRLRVNQPDDNHEWLEGKIAAFNVETGKHEILFDSGRVKHADLNDLDYEWKNDQGQKPVEKLDLKTGQVLATFASTSAAACASGDLTRASRIVAVCGGRYKSSHGFFWRYKGSENLPRKPKGRRRIEQLCLKSGRVMASFDTIRAAGEAVGITTPGISYCCNGRNGSKSAGGYGWRFAVE